MVNRFFYQVAPIAITSEIRLRSLNVSRYVGVIFYFCSFIKELDTLKDLLIQKDLWIREIIFKIAQLRCVTNKWLYNN